MATHRSKSGAAGRHKAARPTQNHTAGKRISESKRSSAEDKRGVDPHDSSSGGESSERAPTRGSRWELLDDETIITRPDDLGGGDAPLADSDEAPEGSER